MDAATSDALAGLEEQRPRLERLLEELVVQGSFTQDRAGVAAVVERLAPELEAAGLAVERIASEAFGPHLAFRGPAAGPPVFLVGHSDTVFPPGTFEGFRRDGDRAVGPGVFDMKGGLAVMAFGLAAAHRAGLLAHVPVAGMIVSDEEVGSPESQPLVAARCRGAAAALVFESGREGDRIVTRRKGVASVRAVAHGVAAHAGNAHAEGRNAIWALARFVDRAQGLTDGARGVTVNVGTISGGTTKNTVPAEARCELDLRFETAAERDALLAALEAAAREAPVEGTRIALSRLSARPPLERSEASAALAAEYGRCQRAAGLGDGETGLVGGGSDACTTAAAGVPSIDGLGPRGLGFHTHAETVELSSLVPKAAALVRFLAARVRQAPSLA
jgi:glutamate carboxypeptidase